MVYRVDNKGYPRIDDCIDPGIFFAWTRMFLIRAEMMIRHEEN